MDLDDLPQKKPQLVVGEPLDAVSLADLEQRIHALEFEIARIRGEIGRKQASRSAADAFFRT